MHSTYRELNRGGRNMVCNCATHEATQFTNDLHHSSDARVNVSQSRQHPEMQQHYTLAMLVGPTLSYERMGFNHLQKRSKIPVLFISTQSYMYCAAAAFVADTLLRRRL